MGKILHLRLELSLLRDILYNANRNNFCLCPSLGKLNFSHSQVFQRMASELLPRVPELHPADVTRFAKSLGFLKWLHIPLFEAFAEVSSTPKTNSDSIHLKHYISVLFS